jgi:hypothetical protein
MIVLVFVDWFPLRCHVPPPAEEKQAKEKGDIERSMT